MPLDVRPARPAEVRQVIDVLRGAGLGANVGRLLDFPLSSACGELIAAADGDDIVGGAAVAGFGETGWIGALGVAARARRRGAGTALTLACVEWLRARGARTVLLYATTAGRPVYQRAGFVADGEARAWRDVAPPRGRSAVNGVRALAPADLRAVRELDRAATGEDRGPVFDALGDAAPGLIAEHEGRVAGSALRSPWGLGPSVVASDPHSGLALLSTLRRAPGGPLTVSLPDANAAAVRALRAWGFAPINQATRMRLGRAPDFQPARVFGMFNLFWG